MQWWEKWFLNQKEQNPNSTKWGLFQVCRAGSMSNIIHCINKLKKENHIIISIEEEKLFEKIQLMIKPIREYEGT